MVAIDYPTFSDSPFFFDNRFSSIPQDETEIVRVGSPFCVMLTGLRAVTFPAKGLLLSSQGCRAVPLRGQSAAQLNERADSQDRHPMRPFRLELTTQLVLGYGLHDRMSIHSPRPATSDEMLEYHSEDYIDFLNRVLPASKSAIKMKNLIEFGESRYNVGNDCPVFSDVFEFCQKYTGGTLAAGRKLAGGETDIAINWSGGLHHAKKGEASGFCFINDIVLAILELLRFARPSHSDIAADSQNPSPRALHRY